MKHRWRLDDILHGQPWEEEAARLRTLMTRYGTLRLDPAMDAPAFKAILALEEEALELMHRLDTYSLLWHEADHSSQQAESLVSKAQTLDIQLEEARRPAEHWLVGKGEGSLDDANAARLIAAAPAYRDTLQHLRSQARHLLSQPEERVVDINEGTLGTALEHVHGRLETNITFLIRDAPGKRRRRVTYGDAISVATRHADPALRRAAYATILEQYAAEAEIRFDVYRGVVKAWDEMAALRGYPSPLSARNAMNVMDDATTDAMLAAVRRNADIFQEFFRWKAEALGMDRLGREDIYAPVQGKEITRPFDEALALVLDAFGRFSPTMRTHAEAIVRNEHLDSHPRTHKSQGGFCTIAGTGTAPYVLMNYVDDFESMNTLAHELGHSVQFLYAAELPFSLQHPSTPMCELGSTFGEMLFFDSLLAQLPPAEGKALLISKIGQSYATIPRQAYFTLFERDAHRMISAGATLDDVSDRYLELLRELHGDAVHVPDHFRHEWLVVPHFVASPFYCLAYAVAEPIALSCYQRWQENRDFKAEVEAIFASGGSRNPLALLAENGMDMHAPEFWDEGMAPLRQMVRRIKE